MNSIVTVIENYDNLFYDDLLHHLKGFEYADALYIILD
jgi:hypothetical protein